MHESESVIDVLGFMKKLWAHKWVWLATFVILGCAGAGYAFTRPERFEVTQSLVVTIPPATSQANAMQQQSSLEAVADLYHKLPLLQPVTTEVLNKHPEIGSLGALRNQVEITGAGLLLNISARGTDQSQLRSLVHDLTEATIAHVPETMDSAADGLQAGLQSVGDSTISSLGSGRTAILAATFVAAVVGATFAAGLLTLRPTK